MSCGTASSSATIFGVRRCRVRKEHRQKLHATNPVERLNSEIKRRTNVVGIILNESAVTHLVGTILLERNDEWTVSRRCMTRESIAPVSDDLTVKLPVVTA